MRRPDLHEFVQHARRRVPAAQQPGASRAVFGYILERDQENTRALANIAETYTRLARPTDAEAARTRLAAIESVPPFHFFNLGLDAAKQSDWRGPRLLRPWWHAPTTTTVPLLARPADWRLGDVAQAQPATGDGQQHHPRSARLAAKLAGCNHGRSPSRPSRPGVRHRRALRARAGPCGDDLVARREEMVHDQIAARHRDPRCSRRCANAARAFISRGCAIAPTTTQLADRGRADDLPAHRRPDAQGRSRPPRRPGARDRRRLGLCQRAREPARRPGRRDRAPPRPGGQRRQRLARLGYAKVEVHCADGGGGWPDGAPFDAILVAASGPRVPAVLRGQLAAGGRLVMPVGPRAGTSNWCASPGAATLRSAKETLCGVVFVPLPEYGWPSGRCAGPGLGPSGPSRLP